MAHRHVSLFIPLVLASACGGSSQPAASPGDSASSGTEANTSAGNDTPAYEKARTEVVRLSAEAEKNPLLAPWTGPYGGVPPWDKLKLEGIPGAFTTGIALLLAEVDVIANNPQLPTFENTLAALEDSGRPQHRAEILFSVLTSNLNTPEVQAVDREWSPKLSAAYDAITFNEKLFKRISAVYAARQSALTPE
ncbi:MAG TPA: hypothetical protein VK524_19690, partial [Polyangiaceae bacterium]|nr:hypothetical protein [Polyangiaceae bacterium]